MGFGHRLRKRFRKTASSAIHRAANPVKAGVDLSKKVTSALHPVTAAIGKLDAVAYGTIGGGIVGAAITKRSGNTKVFGKTGVETIAPAAIQIEKPLAALAGGLIAGGIGSSLAGAAAGGIAGDDVGGIPSGRDFNSFGADSSPLSDGPVAAGGRISLANVQALVWVGIGGTVLVVLVFALKKRRR